MKNRTQPQAMLHIQAVSPDAVRALKESIVEILRLDTCGDTPKAEAMVTMRETLRQGPISISGCTFNAKP